MRTFKDLYAVISYSLLIAQLGFISILLYNKLIYHRELYYGGDKPPDQISANYFNILRTLLYATFVLIVAWALLTPLAILSNKRTVVDDERLDIAKGLVGFIAAIALLITDPFGIFKWFTA